MPSVPPFSRSEKVADYVTQCRPASWQEHSIKSGDGTVIKLLEGRVPRPEWRERPASKTVVVLYLQGNASSLPPRLPHLSRVLAAAQDNPKSSSESTAYCMVALSYRGFWTSHGRPSQRGIELDTTAALDWILLNFDVNRTDVVIWGQSIGAGAATVSLSNMLRQPGGMTKLARISGVLLETPFVDLKSMLVALYPQKFLPYRYLAPFLLSTWDSKTALSALGAVKPRLRVLMLQAGDDELVPDGSAATLEMVCKDHNILVNRQIITGALHTNVMMKPAGRQAAVSFLRSFND